MKFASDAQRRAVMAAVRGLRRVGKGMIPRQRQALHTAMYGLRRSSPHTLGRQRELIQMGYNPAELEKALGYRLNPLVFAKRFHV